MVQRAWDLNQLAQGYVEFLATYQPVLTEVRTMGRKSLDPITSFLARSLMIHDYRRLLLRDPELPAELLPPLWRPVPCVASCTSAYRRTLKPIWTSSCNWPMGKCQQPLRCWHSALPWGCPKCSWRPGMVRGAYAATCPAQTCGWSCAPGWFGPMAGTRPLRILRGPGSVSPEAQRLPH